MLAYPDNTSSTGSKGRRLVIYLDTLRSRQATPEGITRDASIEPHRLPGRFIHLLC